LAFIFAFFFCICNYFLIFSSLGLLESFGDVERNMCFRRAELARLLRDGESLMSISFPALGTIDFTRPPMKMLEELDAGGKAPPGSSRFFSDEMISKSHPRLVRKMDF
jgi:hypothetical protein